MEKFGFSGLWKSIGSTVISAGLLLGDGLVTYFNAVELPQWAHALVGVAAAILAFYKGKSQPAVKAVPSP